MDELIEKALHLANQEQQRIGDFQNRRHAGDGDASSYQPSAAAEHGLQALYAAQQALIERFKALPTVQTCAVGSESSLAIRWDTAAETVIELSQWGALAAVFTYGMIDSLREDQISNALEQQSLAYLTEPLIDGLEAGTYHLLFHS